MPPRLVKWLASLRGAGWHLARGLQAERRGRLEDACRQYRAALYAEPGNAFAHYNLGKTLFVRGDLPGAEASLRAALASKPDFPEAYVVLSSVLEGRGQNQAAVETLRAAIAHRPGYGGALRNLGLLHYREGRWGEAAAALAEAAAADPEDADAQYWLGNALVHLERPDEAADRYRGALRIRPEHPAALCHLGNVLADQGRSGDAEAHLRKALALAPQLADAHVGLGNLYAADQRYLDAAACYRAALERDPGHVQARINLGNALVYLGDSAGALSAYEAALALDPENAMARWARALCRIPAIREADADLARIRADFGRELAALDAWFDARRSADGHVAVGVQQPFWLAYQAEDNLGLLRAYGRLCARLMAAWQDRAGLHPRARRAAGPIRVGVVSQYFRRHPVWDALVKGWFQELDRRRFALYGYCLGAARDEETRFAQSRAARFVQARSGLRQWVEAILEDRLDVLIYPEVGMDPMTIKLASLRLAPVQAATWGHPETTGLPTIDYYLSAAGLEPEGAQAYYAERLIALPHLGCRVEPRGIEACAAHPGRWGLPADVPLLLCPGTPFKYAPEHDALYAEIARRLGECRLCFFVYGIPELSERLRHRLARAFAARGVEFERHVSFIQWLPRQDFYGLMARADLMLDTPGFSGFNTALQAMECGLPVVTCEGRFLRGRLASGVLRHIGLPELVARDDAGYVDLAVRLALDVAYRDQVRQRIAAGRSRLYADAAPIRALENFLQDAVGAYATDSR